MQPLTHIHSCVIPLLYSNIDTDQIIPARFLKVTDKSGLAQGLFERWRYAQDGTPEPGFPLNQQAAQGCSVLVTGDNFGSGSSREHAPWALMEWGIRSVISTSIADIFRSNALKNGLLPVVVGAAFHRKIFDLASKWLNTPTNSLSSEEKLARFGVVISVEHLTVTLPDGDITSFEIDPFSKTCMLQGVDPLGYLLKHESTIHAYEQKIQQIIIDDGMRIPSYRSKP